MLFDASFHVYHFVSWREQCALENVLHRHHALINISERLYHTDDQSFTFATLNCCLTRVHIHNPFPLRLTGLHLTAVLLFM